MNPLKSEEIHRALCALEESESFGSKRNVKIDALKKYSKNKTLRKLIVLTYDSYSTYGYIPPEDGGSSGSGIFATRKKATAPDLGANWKEFKSILKRLSTRELTGNAAANTVEGFLKSVTELESKWYRRVLRRDLRIGMQFSTLDKVWPGLLVKYVVNLAKEYPKTKLPDMPLVLEPKYDGIRMLVVVSDNACGVFSRNGREYPNLQFLADMVAEVHSSIVLDGEILSKTWNLTSKLIRTEPHRLSASNKKKLLEITLNVFDSYTPEGFAAGYENMVDSLRRKRLKSVVALLHKKGHKNFKVAPRWTIKDESDIDSLFNSLLEEGFEGVMIKNPRAIYEPKNFSANRSPHWLKYKPWEDKSGTIVALEEGTRSNKGRLGAFVVELEDGSVTRVGGGFKKKERIKFFKRGADKLVGKIVEFKQQRDSGTGVAVARFPEFLRIRNPEDE